MTWGDQSWDEMMLGYFDLLVPRNLTDKKVMKTAINPDNVMTRFDKDQDGQDLARRGKQGHDILNRAFPLADTNRDGYLDKAGDRKGGRTGEKQPPLTEFPTGFPRSSPRQALSLAAGFVTTYHQWPYEYCQSLMSIRLFECFVG